MAPEPRDVYWANLAISDWSTTVRTFLSSIAILLLLAFWSVPVYFVASLLSYETVKKYAKPIAKLIDTNPRVRAIVQNSLPSLAIISFNGLLPIIFEGFCVFQGLRARSWIEYSILKKYFLFLIINVFFVFVTASTLALTRDLVGQPMKLFEKLATSLPGARIFFISYVMLQALALMPIQLVQLAVILPRLFFRVFLTRTPRDFAELNNPPTLNLGVVYPPAILVFIIGLTYSVIVPLILPFTTLYFGFGYLVYKYKLLFVYYRTYESRGQAWPISFTRLSFGLLLFQLFMTSLFFLDTAFVISLMMVPLLFGTFWSCYRMHHSFSGLSERINLSQAAEVQRSTSSGPGDVERLHKGYPVTRSQMNLNRVRYGSKDPDTAYIVSKDSRTDYSQPPMSDAFPGVLNTGRRRYAHPAIFGLLPAPWLPAMPEKDAGLGDVTDVSKAEAIVLDLRQRWRQVKRATRQALHLPEDDGATRAWRAAEGEPAQAERAADDDAHSEVEDSDGDTEDEREEADSSIGISPYRPFVPHPERRASGFPPPSSTTRDDDEQK